MKLVRLEETLSGCRSAVHFIRIGQRRFAIVMTLWNQKQMGNIYKIDRNGSIRTIPLCKKFRDLVLLALFPTILKGPDQS